MEPLISQITSIVARISQKQPVRKPREWSVSFSNHVEQNAVFNHYVFEAMASIVRYVTKANPQSVETFEKLLFPSFQYILSKDVIGTVVHEELDTHCWTFYQISIVRLQNLRRMYISFLHNSWKRIRVVREMLNLIQ